MDNIHISIAAEELFKIGPLPVTNSLLTSWIIVAGLCIFAKRVSKTLKKFPSKKQLLIELPIEALHNLTVNVAGKKASVFFPYVATFFLYILFSNWSELIPGVGTLMLKPKQVYGIHNVEDAKETGLEIVPLETDEHEPIPLFRAPSADLNMTIALALFSVGLIQYFGFKSLGKSYLKKFFSFGNPLNTFVGGLELISEIAKIISFSFRLFGNIFAGEVLLAVTAFLIPFLAPIPFYGLEVFVGFIQALVFAMLSLVFMNMATIKAEH